jgi:puromycin-sensitive aminopeptidase
MIFLQDKVRHQDAWGPIFSASSGSILGRQLTWDYVKEKWETYKGIFQGGFLLSRVVEISTIGFIGEDKATDIEEFFKANPVPTAERTIQQSLEAIRMNTQWLARDGPSIKAWLEANHTL